MLLLTYQLLRVTLMIHFYSQIEPLNFALFLWINASEHSSTVMLSIGMLLANYLIFLFPLILVLVWVVGNTEKRKAVFNAGVCSITALLVNIIIGLMWQHPRPFLVPIGHTFIPHIADSSFPSDHMTFCCAVSFSLMRSKSFNIVDKIALIMSVAIGWSRVYMGVHFPFDMLGAVFVAYLVVQIIHRYNMTIQPLFILSNTLYHKIIQIFRQNKRCS